MASARARNEHPSSGFDHETWRDQITLRVTPFAHNPLHELRLSGSDSPLSFLLFSTIQPFCVAFEHAPIAAVLALSELTRHPGANYLVHHARRFQYQGASLVERELRHTPELRVALDDLALELGTVPFVLQRMSAARIDWLRRAIEQELARYSPVHEFQHLRRQLGDPAWQLRFAELQGLRETSGVYGPRELALLSDCLRDGSSHVRAAAARLLGQAKIRLPEGLLRQLIQVAVYDGELETRSAASRALGNLREQAAAAPLLQQLRQLLGDDDQFVRSAAAMTLGQLGDAVVLPGLNDALVTLLSDSDAYVREAAARALGRIGAPAAVPRVLAHLTRAVDDPDANVHDAANEALGRLRRLRATQPLNATYIDSAVA